MPGDNQLVWVTPLPPVASGIAQYSQDLLSAMGGAWPVSVLGEPDSGAPPANALTANQQQARAASHRILQVGNSQHHRHAYGFAERGGDILVLHDVVLHHARLAGFVQHGRARDYLDLMESLYGQAGREAGQTVLRGGPIDVNRFPLSEDFVRKAAAIVVHSDHARNRVLDLVPSAAVHVVPMGVPLPALVDADDCRQALGLPEDAFVLSSITHVNPMKRIPVVLRAFRRLVERHPNAIFVIAGSIAHGMDIEQQVRLLGLQSRVRLTGYLDDREARLLARASDVCVNLRYPSTGETSASLLRLMGAGRPVIVTSHGSMEEIPEGAAIHLPVDRLEEETLAEYLVWLAADRDAREEIGRSARDFIETSHAMHVSLDAYRQAIRSVWNVDIPEPGDDPVHEPSPVISIPTAVPEEPREPDVLVDAVTDRLVRLGLAGHDGTIQSVAGVLARFDVPRACEERPVTEQPTRTIDPELLEILACPVCKARVELEGETLTCVSCGRVYRIENGIPIMLVEDDE